MINLMCPTKEMVMLALKVKGEIVNLDYTHETTVSPLDSDHNYYASGFILFKDSEPFITLSNNIRELALLIGGDIYKWFSEEKQKVSEDLFFKMKIQSRIESGEDSKDLKDLINIDDILEDLNRLKYNEKNLVIENPRAFHSLLRNTESLIRSVL